MAVILRGKAHPFYSEFKGLENIPVKNLNSYPPMNIEDRKTCVKWFKSTASLFIIKGDILNG